MQIIKENGKRNESFFSDIFFIPSVCKGTHAYASIVCVCGNWIASAQSNLPIYMLPFKMDDNFFPFHNIFYLLWFYYFHSLIVLSSNKWDWKYDSPPLAIKQLKVIAIYNSFHWSTQHPFFPGKFPYEFNSYNEAAVVYSRNANKLIYAASTSDEQTKNRIIYSSNIETKQSDIKEIIMAK